MSTNNAIPDRDPANDDSMAGMFVEVLKKFLQNNIDDMLPAIVQTYDAQTNRATVKPLIKVLATDDTEISRAQIASVPVFQIGGGGFILNFNNIKQGDLGWIKANDRDISLFLQSYEESKPNTVRKHDFSDSLFFPDVMRGYSVVDGEQAVLQKTDGSVKIALKDDSIEIMAATNVNVFASEEVNIEGGQTVNIDSAASVNVESALVNIGSKVNLGLGGLPIARVGDAVTIPSTAAPGQPSSGTITSGSPNHTAN